MIPEGFEPIYNDQGIAPGLFGKEGDTLIAILPGPPRELRAVFERLKDRISGLSEEVVLFKTLKTFGRKESEIVEVLEPHMDKLRPLGFYPSIYGVDIRLEARGKDRKALEEELNEKAARIKNLLGPDVYGEDDDTLEAVFGRIMRKKRLTVATAESCTGGLVANIITDVSGSSNYMIGSVVAYHNRIKEEVLGVPREILARFGAVSEPTARLMAEGVRKLYEVDLGLSTTGIAGPTGGTPQKPVGLVYMGVSLRGKTKVIKRIFKGNRLEIKRQTALNVIDLARRMLLEL
jgi:nicotinamide-nucleotide amidase